jgi:hypothetical protein
MNPTGGVIDLFSNPYQDTIHFQLPLFLSNGGGTSELDSIVPALAHLGISGVRFDHGYGKLRITIPGLKRGNQSFQTLLTPGSEDTLIDISSYQLELTNLPDRKNLIDVRIDVFFPKQQNILFVTPPMAQFGFEIAVDEWEIIYGYIGQGSIEFQPAFFNTDFDRKFPDGDFYFAEPQLKFRSINSFGIPLGMGFSPITAQTGIAGMIELTGPGVPTPPDYFYPSWPRVGSEEPEAGDSLVIDYQNSNLKEIISAEPERIDYQLVFITNPGEEKQQNMVRSSDYFYSQVDLELPFHGKASELSLKDTLAINLSDQNIPLDEDVRNVIFKLYYENYFPADIHLQLYLANEFMVITDTLFESFSEIKGTEPTASREEDPVFVSGEVQTSLPGTRIEDIKNARYLIGEARLTTVGERDDVKIFDNQHLFMSLGVILDIKTTLEDF